MSLIVRELSQQELPGIFPFIKQLNPKMTKRTFSKLLPQMITKGYRCAGAFDSDGTLLGIAGFWELCRFWCGMHVDIDNVVIDTTLRNRGIGKALVAWIEDWARQRGHSFAVLDSYAHNIDSHRFYYREGYVIRGYHFTKDL